MNVLEFHPLANIFPLIEGDEFSALVEDVKTHGVRDPVWTFEAKILDGRNRYRAAREAQVECPTREYEGDDPVGFVVSLNLKRRHLNESQRAMVAAKLANLAHGQKKADVEISTSQADAAKLLNVSRETVNKAKSVQRDGAPELVSAVEKGKVSVSAAALIAKQDKDTQKRIVAEDNLKRATAELRQAEKAAREAAALPKAKPISPEEKAEQQRIFGTEEDRATFLEVTRIVDIVANFPDAAQAAASIPPAFEHAVDIEAIREVARWFDAFANAYQDKESTRVAAQ